MLLFIEYPKCTTCQKARKWLEDNNIAFKSRHVKDQKPNVEELSSWHKTSGLPIKRFVNTSGLLYRSMNLKEKLPLMTDTEIVELLATDGMLVKRPIIVGDGFVLPGFKEAEWREALGL